jgi:hypothetical protein
VQSDDESASLALSASASSACASSIMPWLASTSSACASNANIASKSVEESEAGGALESAGTAASLLRENPTVESSVVHA